MYRVGGVAQAVDTVPFGAFRRELFQDLGGFDETLLSNEDYEFNVRVRRRGGVVWMDPDIRSTYMARATLKEVARQYWRYGYWKHHMLRRYPDSIRWRQALPAAFVLALLGAVIAAVVWPPAVSLLAGIIGLYLFALLVAGIHMACRAGDASIVFGGMLALATMHLSWGTGFWSGLLRRRGEGNG
jgi:uncharacterized membrane protein